VGAHQVLMLGTLDASLDGRYFGPVDRSLIRGRAWRVF
jgi:type IV secretory pathway protease TraF